MGKILPKNTTLVVINRIGDLMLDISRLHTIKNHTENYLINEGNEKIITKIDELLQLLPQYNQSQIKSLIDIRRGTEEGRMETLGLVNVVTAEEVYRITEKGVHLSQEMFALDLEAEACNPRQIEMPNHLQFIAEWDKKTLTSGNGNNILGDNGGLFMQEPLLQIPVVKATAETLAYYGAVLIAENTIVRFPNDEAYPLWKMHVGPKYVTDYIMSEEGGGFYLEFHHDQPHFHMVLDGGGYYLLAKQISDKTFQITAFELSNGQAVYTKKGAIHCDAALTGDLIVGYNASKDCSTVLLRTKEEKKMVQLEFC